MIILTKMEMEMTMAAETMTAMMKIINRVQRRTPLRLMMMGLKLLHQRTEKAGEFKFIKDPYIFHSLIC